jgi:Zn-dependent protease
MLKRILRDPSATLHVRGVPVRLQASFVLLPAWAAYVGYVTDPQAVQGAFFLALFMVLIYACALLHELGHILPARLYGASVTRVRISGMGAFVQVENKRGIPPAHDLAIALGGPLVSGLVSLALAGLAWHELQAHDMGQWLALLWQRSGLTMLILLAATNTALTLFNLLPFFPMDGGRALSASLALFLAPARATRLVSAFGQLTAVVVLPLALILPTYLLLRIATALTAALIFLVSLQVSRPSRPRTTA